MLIFLAIVFGIILGIFSTEFLLVEHDNDVLKVFTFLFITICYALLFVPLFKGISNV
jgi:hypothetical protein